MFVHAFVFYQPSRFLQQSLVYEASVTSCYRNCRLSRIQPRVVTGARKFRPRHLSVVWPSLRSLAASLSTYQVGDDCLQVSERVDDSVPGRRLCTCFLYIPVSSMIDDTWSLLTRGWTRAALATSDFAVWSTFTWNSLLAPFQFASPTVATFAKHKGAVHTTRMHSVYERRLKMICNDFLVVKVNCWSYVFNIIQSIWILRNIKR